MSMRTSMVLFCGEESNNIHLHDTSHLCGSICCCIVCGEESKNIHLHAYIFDELMVKKCKSMYPLLF